jgi:TPR repeat protein
LAETVREWRRAAWQRDDLFAEVTLGDLYSRDDSFYDPVEGYVWYFMALRPDHLYDASPAAQDALNQIWQHAADQEEDIYNEMSLDQRLEARARLIYILANRGSDGFITLGRLHRDRSVLSNGVCRDDAKQDPPAHWQGRSDSTQHSDDGPCPDPQSAIVLSNADSLMYFDIAADERHPLAPAYVASQEDLVRSLPHGDEIIADARSRARNWLPGFEFYPGQTRGGTLHSDESIETEERHQALMRVDEIPPDAISQALMLAGAAAPDSRPAADPGGPSSAMGAPPAPLDPSAPIGPAAADPSAPPGSSAQGDYGPDDSNMSDPAVQHFQETIGDDQTGVLTPAETVRLIQMAAVNGDANAQVELGVMYTKGIGVPRNYPRAQQWFAAADRQGNCEATYYLGVLYKVGVDGVPHDDDKASRLFAESGICGFEPVRSQLLDLLSVPASGDIPPPAPHPRHHHHRSPK